MRGINGPRCRGYLRSHAEHALFCNTLQFQASFLPEPLKGFGARNAAAMRIPGWLLLRDNWKLIPSLSTPRVPRRSTSEQIITESWFRTTVVKRLCLQTEATAVGSRM